MLDWHRIDTVLLDMDGTLLDLHFDNYFWVEFLPQRYTDTFGGELEQNRSALMEQIMAKRGSLEWYCFDYWSDALKLDISALKTELKHKIKLRDGTLEFLQALSTSDKRVWLATNSHRDGLELKMAETGIGHFFEQQIVSHDYGAAKESPAFWDAMLAEHPFDPSRCLFVDDSLAVLESAQAWGIEQLLCIRQPDSRQAPRHDLPFPAINHFNEVLPLSVGT